MATKQPSNQATKKASHHLKLHLF